MPRPPQRLLTRGGCLGLDVPALVGRQPSCNQDIERLELGGRRPSDQEAEVAALDPDEILGRLSGLGGVTARPLFGSHGLYWGETIFGILFGGRLYFKVDDESKEDYLARGMGPFRPNDRQTLKSYYEVPPDVLADRESLHSWAGEAIRVGQNGL